MYTLLNFKEMNKTNLLSEEVLKTIQTISASIGIQPYKIHVKPEKVYTVPQQLTILLNKLSEDNYTTIHDTIIELMQTVTEFDVISVVIFDIIMNNSFYGQMYAKLYTSLIQQWSIFK
jgi:CRISPR/Cas system endoribonuclease Cas6 (RAMP superfamily)